ncbi:MAG: DUF4384 domain-containing protein [Bryobacteraceae bacterium]
MKLNWLIIFAASTVAAVAQEHPLKARELFYAPPPSAKAVQKSANPVKPEAPKRTTPKADVPRVDVMKPSTPEVQARTTPEVRRDTSRPNVPVMNASMTNQVPLALRYSVVKRNEHGSFVETDSDSVFHTGDRIRINVQANDSGFLYVVMRGSSGAWRVLFPARDEAGGDNRVVRGKSYTIPPGKNGQFFFDETGGEEKLFLVLTRRPEPDLEALVYSMSDKERKPEKTEKKEMLLAENRPPISDMTVARFRNEFRSRDLVFEKVDEETADKTEKAVYVANPSGEGDARLVVDVVLKHSK